MKLSITNKCVIFYIFLLFGCLASVLICTGEASAKVADYYNVVQRMYLGYYDRPADPQGLLYWATRLDQSNGNLNDIIYDFSNSAESKAVYGIVNSDNIERTINSIYLTLFGRLADTADLLYYANGFRNGTFSASTIPINILYGAQGQDRIVIDNKMIAANLFTTTVLAKNATYSGDADIAAARTFLIQITADPISVPTENETSQYVIENYLPKNQLTQITLAWDPNPEPTIAGYKIYYGLSSGYYDCYIDVGNVSSYTLVNLSSGKTYYLAATAYDDMGTESEYSNEVVFRPR
jgi:hypothetical protein